MKHIYLFLYFVCVLSSADAKPIWVEKKPDLDSNSEHVYRIQCIDSNNCLALSPHGGYYGRLYSSTDQGRNWVRIWNDFTGDFNDYREESINMSYPVANHIFVILSGSTLLKTNNNGTSWDTVTFLPDNLRLYNIYMQDTLSGVIAGQEHPIGQPYLILTHDGWKTHKAIPRDSLPLDAFITYPYIEGKDTVMFFSSIEGMRVLVYLSVDQCKTWKIDTLSDIGSLYYYGKPYIKSKTGEYWLAGCLKNGIGNQSYDVIYKLDKIGGTWTKVYSGDLEPTFGLQEIAFGDALNGVAVGQFGKILRTTDGGKTWFQEFLTYNGVKDKVDPPVMHVEYCGSTPLIGDFVGRIFRLEDDGTEDVEEENYNFALYPNPASEFINIDEDILNGAKNIEIYNAIGIKVLEVSSAASRINIAALSSGIYSLKCGDRVQSFVKY